MTYLQAVNQVLQRLRESTVTQTSSNSYSSLIAVYVNDAKRMVEDAWEWSVLQQTFNITTSSGVFGYALNGADQRTRIFQVLNDTEDHEILKTTNKQMNRNFKLGDTQNASPIHWDLNGYDSDGQPIINFWPVPDSAYEIDVNTIDPQPDLDTDTDTFLVPSHLVVLAAYAMAVEERGEQGGISAPSAWARYQESLADAIAIDASRHHYSETSWNVV